VSINTNQMYAIKQYEKSQSLLNKVQEIGILRRIDHQNVVKLFEVFEDQTHLYLVMEYLGGGTILQHKYTEKEAYIAIKGLLEALNYCHSKNITIKHIKPENLLLSYFSN